MCYSMFIKLFKVVIFEKGIKGLICWLVIINDVSYLLPTKNPPC